MAWSIALSIFGIVVSVLTIRYLCIPGFNRNMDVVDERRRKTGELAHLNLLLVFIYGISGLFLVLQIVSFVAFIAVLLL